MKLSLTDHLNEFMADPSRLYPDWGGKFNIPGFNIEWPPRADDFAKEQLKDALKLSYTRTRTSRAISIIKHPSSLIDQALSVLRRVQSSRNEHRSLLSQMIAYEDAIEDLGLEIKFEEEASRQESFNLRGECIEAAKNALLKVSELQAGRGHTYSDEPAFQHAAGTKALQAVQFLARVGFANSSLKSVTIDTAKFVDIRPCVNHFEGAPGVAPTEFDSDNSVEHMSAAAQLYLSALLERRSAIGIAQADLELESRGYEAEAAHNSLQSSSAQIKIDAGARQFRIATLKRQLERLINRAEFFTNDYRQRIALIFRSFTESVFEGERCCIDLANALRRLDFQHDFSFSANEVLKPNGDADAIISELEIRLLQARRDWAEWELSALRTTVMAQSVKLENDIASPGRLVGGFSVPKYLKKQIVEALAVRGDSEEMGELSIMVQSSDVVQTVFNSESGKEFEFSAFDDMLTVPDEFVVKTEIIDREPVRIKWAIKVDKRGIDEISPSTGAFLVNIRPDEKLMIAVDSNGRTEATVDVMIQMLGYPILY